MVRNGDRDGGDRRAEVVADRGCDAAVTRGVVAAPQHVAVAADLRELELAGNARVAGLARHVGDDRRRVEREEQEPPRTGGGRGGPPPPHAAPPPATGPPP